LLPRKFFLGDAPQVDLYLSGSSGAEADERFERAFGEHGKLAEKVRERVCDDRARMAEREFLAFIIESEFLSVKGRPEDSENRLNSHYADAERHITQVFLKDGAKPNDEIFADYFDRHLCATGRYFDAMQTLYLLSLARESNRRISNRDLQKLLYSVKSEDERNEYINDIISHFEQMHLVRTIDRKFEVRWYEVTHDFIAEQYIRYATSTIESTIKQALDYFMIHCIGKESAAAAPGDEGAGGDEAEVKSAPARGKAGGDDAGKRDPVRRTELMQGNKAYWYNRSLFFLPVPIIADAIGWFVFPEAVAKLDLDMFLLAVAICLMAFIYNLTLFINVYCAMPDKGRRVGALFLLVFASSVVFVLFMYAYTRPPLRVAGFLVSPYVLFAFAFACTAVAVGLAAGDKNLTEAAGTYFRGLSIRLLYGAGIILVICIISNWFLDPDKPRDMSILFSLAIFVCLLFGYITHLNRGYYASGLGMMGNIKLGSQSADAASASSGGAVAANTSQAGAVTGNVKGSVGEK
jgi:hypothetical protein